MYRNEFIMRKKSKTKIFIIIFLIIAVLYPLIEMLVRVEWSDFSKLVTSHNFIESLTNSLFVTTIATIISIAIAYVLAFTLNRTNIKHRAVLKVLLTLPMLIPSISHGLGLINLFGVNGIISKALSFNIIGSIGIIMGSIIYSFPVAFLMLDDGFNYIDNSMYDAAKTLGLNKWQTFKKVTLCYLKKPIISATFAVFTMIFTDYGVPLAVGGKFLTLPVFLYKEVIGLLDFSRGTIIGLFLLVPAFISFLFDNFTKDHTNTSNNKGYIIPKNKLRDILLTTFTYLVLIFIVVLIGSFVYYRRRPIVRSKFRSFVNNMPRNIIRTKGIMWYSNDNDNMYIFEQAGPQTNSFQADVWIDTLPEPEKSMYIKQNPDIKRDWDEKVGDRMVKLVFIGQKMDKESIISALDSCLD